MSTELLVAVLVAVALAAGFALGWGFHQRFARSADDVTRNVLLARAQRDLERLEGETGALRAQLSAARAEKAALEPQVARIPDLDAKLAKAHDELVAINEARGALQSKVDDLPSLRGALEQEQAALRRSRDELAQAQQSAAQLSARLEGEQRAHEKLRGEAQVTLALIDTLRLQLAEAAEARTNLQARADAIPGLERALGNEREEAKRLRTEATAVESARARVATELEQTKLRIAEQQRSLGELEARFREAFQSLAAEALRTNNQAFLDLAKTTMSEFQQGAKVDLEGRQKAIDQVVAPVREALQSFDAAVRGIEKDRLEAYSGLREQVASLRDSQRQLQVETSGLVKALRAPTARGRWGEYQLRRVVELAGMEKNCDFTEQAHVEVEDGRLRPDVIVRLPGTKTTVIDAKVPLLAYLNAVEATDEEARRAYLKDHARQVRTHVTQLGSKAYWDQLPSSPDFVVMYVPMESAFAAALQEDPGLIDHAVECRVIPCGPMTLLTHLKAAAYGWRQERIAANAERISELGKELYNRLGSLAEHLDNAGKHLGKATAAYNSAVGTLESRVLVSARRFRDLGAATGDEIAEVSAVRLLPREVQLPERRAGERDPGPLLEAAEAAEDVLKTAS